MINLLLGSTVCFVSSGMLSDFFAALVASGVVCLVHFLFSGKEYANE